MKVINCSNVTLLLSVLLLCNIHFHFIHENSCLFMFLLFSTDHFLGTVQTTDVQNETQVLKTATFVVGEE